MSLDTVINASMNQPRRPANALVLMGGGARTAYQVGVLRALASMLGLQAQTPKTFPFQVLIGTSAGALNAAFLAGCATQGLQAFDQLADFWGAIRSADVYRLQVPSWVRMSKFATALSLSRHARNNGAILDNLPLVDTLHRAVSLPGIDKALASRTLEALAVTASSYTSGVHWTFCHTAQDNPMDAWARPGRRSEFHPITIEHLMASSAIPFLRVIRNFLATAPCARSPPSRLPCIWEPRRYWWWEQGNPSAPDWVPAAASFRHAVRR